MATVVLAEMLMVVALTPVEHNGVKYGPDLPDGDTFELKETEAAPLLAVGAVKRADVEDGGSAAAEGSTAPKATAAAKTTATAKK